MELVSRPHVLETACAPSSEVEMYVPRLMLHSQTSALLYETSLSLLTGGLVRVSVHCQTRSVGQMGILTTPLATLTHFTYQSITVGVVMMMGVAVCAAHPCKMINANRSHPLELAALNVVGS